MLKKSAFFVNTQKKYPQNFNFTLCEIEISKEFYQFIQDVLWIAYVPNKLPREEGI